jgi:hypothetical protein
MARRGRRDGSTDGAAYQSTRLERDESKIGARTDAHLVWLATAAGIVTPDSVG